MINKSQPFNLEKTIHFLNNGFHNLKVRVCDDIDNCSTQEVEFNLVLDKIQKNPDINLKLTEPINGVALNIIDFPLPIKFNTNNYSKIKIINIYYLLEDNIVPYLIDTIKPIENNNIVGTWNNLPSAGSYQVYGEAISESGQITTSGKIILIISNEKVDEKEVLED